MYLEYIKNTQKSTIKKNHPIKKWAKDLKDTYLKKIYKLGDNSHISIQEAFATDYLFKDAGISTILKIHKALPRAEGKFVYYQ